MATSCLPRADDLAAIYRLIGDCRDLWYDWRAWRHRLLDGLCRLVGGCGGISGEVESALTEMPAIVGRVRTKRRNSASRQNWQQFTTRDVAVDDPAIHWALGLIKVDQDGKQGEPFSWDGLETQTASPPPTPRVFRKAYAGDAYLCSHRALRARADAIDVIEVRREPGDRAFDRREARIINWLHREVEPLVGRQLASARQPSMTELSPRLREVLLRLLDGDSEKQMSAGLKLSSPTVHEYVQTLYRRFGVGTRAELMSRWIHLFPPRASAEPTD